MDIKKRDSFIALGRIVKSHGLKGFVQIYPYSRGDSLLDSSRVYLNKEKGLFVPFHVSEARFKKKKALLILFKEISDRNMADELVGLEVFLKKSDLPQLDNDEYYWFQLKGLDVYDIDDVLIGRIRDITETGGHDLLLIEGMDGHDVMIPMVKAMIVDIDVDSGKCRVDLPDGLLDINT